MSSAEMIDTDDGDDETGSERTAQKLDIIDHFEPVFKMIEEIETEIESVRKFFDDYRFSNLKPDTESVADSVVSDDQPKADEFVERSAVVKRNDNLLLKCFDCNQIFNTDDNCFRRLSDHYVCGQHDCRFRATRDCPVAHHKKMCGMNIALTSTANNTENNGQKVFILYRCDYDDCAQIFLTETQLKNHKSKDHV